jgi:hypothetical protein
VRSRARILLVPLALASLATVLVAAPAHAVEAKQQTHLVAQFKSGHTGWIKIALEKDLSNNKARAHAAIWCQNASGARVDCGAITYKSDASWLEVQHWDETYGWQYDLTLPLCAAGPPDCRQHNFGIQDEYTSWGCTGEGNDQYRAVIYNVKIEDAFGEESTWKTRTHPTWLGSYC